MQCPNCQSEVPDWHAYCPECRCLVQEFQPAEEQPTPAPKQLGWRFIPVLLGVFVLGALIVLARDVNLNDQLQSKPEDGAAKAAAVAAAETATPTPTRRSSNAPPSKTGESTPQPKPTTAEGSQLAALTEPSSAPSEITADTSAGAALEVETAEEEVSSNVGLLTIKSYTRARLYVDGQFSGYTPRTIKLVPGEHKVTLLADGHEEWSRSVKLKGGQQTGIMASLEKKTAQ